MPNVLKVRYVVDVWIDPKMPGRTVPAHEDLEDIRDVLSTAAGQFLSDMGYRDPFYGLAVATGPHKVVSK
jgi:hypothetical protein